MKKVQITGAAGMLGRCVVDAFRHNGWDIVSSPIDITVVTATDIAAPLVINCAAITDKTAPQCKMVLVNAIGPHLLARACDDVGARLIHISTDMVFMSEGPHKESDGPNPTTIAGYAKLFGEVSRQPHLTTRASLIGVGKRSLLGDIQRSVAANPIIASNRLLWSGVTAPTYANLLVKIAEREEITGILHVPGEFTTRYELCLQIADRLGVPRAHVKQDDSFIADRRLVSERWLDLDLPTIKPLKDQLQELVI